MKSIDWNEVRGIALDCLSSSLELLTWARRSQQEDYDVGSATLHLAAIDKARDCSASSLGILSIGIDDRSSDSLRQFPICDQLAQASSGETARPDFGVAATAHEAVFRLLMIALLHIENNLNGGLTLEDLHGVSPEKLRVTLRALEKNDSIEHVLCSVGYLHNLQAWIHREWAAVSGATPKDALRQRSSDSKVGRPKGAALSKYEIECLRYYSDGKKPSEIDDIMMQKTGSERQNGSEWQWGTASLVIEAAKGRGQIPRKSRKEIP